MIVMKVLRMREKEKNLMCVETISTTVSTTEVTTETGSGADFDCITDFEVSHYRASEGYKNNYYDIMGDDGNKKKSLIYTTKS